MATIEEKFAKLGVDNAPGQEVRKHDDAFSLKGGRIEGARIDFSHGDVNAFPPAPGTFDLFKEGYNEGAAQAYTEYRGRKSIRENLAEKLSAFTGTQIDADSELIITPGTQGALFLAMGANICHGDKVAIVEPDYFANHKLVEFFEGTLLSVPLDYLCCDKGKAGLNLSKLEEIFASGVKLFIFSNPNNPTGAIYSPEEVYAIGSLAQKYNVKVLVDELYSRQIFDERVYTHLCSLNVMDKESLITVFGPSKTESLSGFRLGVGIGSPSIIKRMEKLQAIVSLRAAGYCQSVARGWFNEPEGWIENRIAEHQAIRDDIVKAFCEIPGVEVRPTEGGSYLFPKLPPLSIDMKSFVQALRIQANVIVTPGTEFSPKSTDSFRINFSQDHTAALEGVNRIAQMIERYRA